MWGFFYGTNPWHQVSDHLENIRLETIGFQPTDLKEALKTVKRALDRYPQCYRVLLMTKFGGSLFFRTGANGDGVKVSTAAEYTAMRPEALRWPKRTTKDLPA